MVHMQPIERREGDFFLGVINCALSWETILFKKYQFVCVFIYYELIIWEMGIIGTAGFVDHFGFFIFF